VCPGIVDTEMEQSDRLIHDYTDDDIKRRIPLARYASPQEVAEAIAFLSDDQLSGFVNGIELRIDGGWLADGGWERTQKA
jgi:NAD(P)-dependent dehydrogenase (short-subunit alcohol dehydrogenase family)